MTLKEFIEKTIKELPDNSEVNLEVRVFPENDKIKVDDTGKAPNILRFKVNNYRPVDFSKLGIGIGNLKPKEENPLYEIKC